MPHQPLYIKIAEDLARQIRQGNFLTGEKFFSRAQLCKRNNISDITAVRVQNYLAELGLVRKVHGSGIFVNYDGERHSFVQQDIPEKPIKHIIEYRSIRQNGFSNGFVAGIESAVADRHIEYSVQLCNLTEVSLQNINAQVINPDVGYLVISTGPQSLLNAAVVLFNPNIRSVVIDTIIPGSHCVLTDCFDGMLQLIDYAQARGYSKFLFAENFSPQPGDFYNAERREAARQICTLRGLSFELCSSGSYRQLLAKLQHQDNDLAILFPQDEPALRLKMLIRQSGLPMPLILGFDNWNDLATKQEQLTTIAVDREKMGRCAVELLLAPASQGNRKQIVRIPGKLQE